MFSRRIFLARIPLAVTAGAALPRQAVAARPPGAPVAPELCLLLTNHWSYTGIGWQMGVSTVAQSIGNCCDMADQTPSVKTGLNFDAHAYAMVAQSSPEVIDRLKHYLAAGKVEIIGGTFGQPMGTMLTGESNIRQLVLGQQTVHKVLGVWVSSFLEEEEFAHPQLPQLLVGAGYRFASMAQCDTWGRHGNPPLPQNVIAWAALDGTSVLATPSDDLVFHPPYFGPDIDWLWSDAGRAQVAARQKLGVPLALPWVEFGWGPGELDGNTPNQFHLNNYHQLPEHYRVQFTTLTEYLEQYGSQATAPVTLHMDDFHKMQPWGVGGDQLRREQRETEAVLAAAERFSAIAHALGLSESRAPEIDDAWTHLLIAQSHDVSLCEGVTGIGDAAALAFIAATGTPEENNGVTTWGALGLRHLRVANQRAHTLLGEVLGTLAASVDTTPPHQGMPNAQAVVVFNPCSTTWDAVASIDAFQHERSPGSDVIVRDAQGHRVPSQLVAAEGPAPTGSGAIAVLFATRQLPPFGYATYSIEHTAAAGAGPSTSLTTSETGFRMENEAVRVDVDGTTGGITSLMDKRHGHELFDGHRCAFPTFSGRPNRGYLGTMGVPVPETIDSRHATARVTWVERGPLRAVVNAVHTWPHVQCEHWITLHAGRPDVECRVRLLADVPPLPGDWPPPMTPLEIVEGYWLSFAPAFHPTAVIRDFPFGVEPTNKAGMDCLTFVDLLGPDGGLLIVHSGTQYFKRMPDGIFMNLAMREWNSHFMAGIYAWPRVAEYRYRLVPHGRTFTNADRLRAVETFDQHPWCVAQSPHQGRLAKQHSFVSLDSPGILISALRGTGDDAFEVRLIEQDGAPTHATLRVDLPGKSYAACDLFGRPSEPYHLLDTGGMPVSLRPWQIQTFRVTR